MNTPEFDLLLSLARTVPDAERAHAIVNAGVDWRAFLDLAARHGVRPMVYKSLLVTCWDRVPEDVQGDWEDAYRAITGRNRFATGELLRINSVFGSAGLPLVSLKGPALGEMTYGDFALREFGDLDLLVKEDDFNRAHGLLNRLGYTPVLHADSEQALLFLWHQGQLTFTSGFGGPDIDLHWQMGTKHTALRLDASHFWPRFQTMQLAGGLVLSFSTQDLLLYLASEAEKDGWIDLRRLCDLAGFLGRCGDLDWAELVETARRLHALRVLLLGLKLAGDLLGAKFPGAVAVLIDEDKALPGLAANVVRRLAGTTSPGLVGQFMVEIEAKDSWHKKVALVFDRLTKRTKSDAELIMLPRQAWWLYRLLRPLRLFGKLLRKGAGPER
jgi:hypothetical protein